MSCTAVLALAGGNARRVFLSFCLGFAVHTSIEAAPQTYKFLQEGYSEGATVSGTFRAEDLDGDGLIESEFGEVLNLTVNWSGNSLVSPFSLSWPEIYVGMHFLWDTEDPVMGGGAGGEFDFAVPPAQYRWRLSPETYPDADYSRVLRAPGLGGRL